MRQQIKHMKIGSTGEAARIVGVAEELGLMTDVIFHEGFDRDLEEGIVVEVYVYDKTTTRIYENVGADEEAQDAYGLGAALGEAMGYWNE